MHLRDPAKAARIGYSRRARMVRRIALAHLRRPLLLPTSRRDSASASTGASSSKTTSGPESFSSSGDTHSISSVLSVGGGGPMPVASRSDQKGRDASAGHCALLLGDEDPTPRTKNEFRQAGTGHSGPLNDLYAHLANVGIRPLSPSIHKVPLGHRAHSRAASVPAVGLILDLDDAPKMSSRGSFQSDWPDAPKSLC